MLVVYLLALLVIVSNMQPYVAAANDEAGLQEGVAALNSMLEEHRGMEGADDPLLQKKIRDLNEAMAAMQRSKEEAKRRKEQERKEAEAAARVKAVVVL